MALASSSWWERTSSRIRNMMAVRFASEVPAHSFWAASAMATAWSMSAWLAARSWASTLPVAGFSTGMVPVGWPSYGAPPIQWVMVCVMICASLPC